VLDQGTGWSAANFLNFLNFGNFSGIGGGDDDTSRRHGPNRPLTVRQETGSSRLQDSTYAVELDPSSPASLGGGAHARR
jgi:hypothetical protein